MTQAPAPPQLAFLSYGNNRLTQIRAQTVVHNYQWAMYRDPANFTLPDSFIPERFLGDDRFANDQKEVFKPFSYGPRDCLGKK